MADNPRAEAPPNPVALPVSPRLIPAELKGLPQWVDWRYEWREAKWTKIPFTCIGQAASSTDPTTWTSFDDALTAYQTMGFDGIGLALREENVLVGIDLDHCRDPDTGDIDAWALEIIHGLQSYTEVTPSSTGFRVFVKGKLPSGGRKNGDIEMYMSGRYLTVTGCHLQETPTTIEWRQAEIDTLHARVFSQRTLGSSDTGKAAHNGASPHLDDDTLIAKALNARNGGKFSRLWSGDIRGYPSHSEADLALCGILAFYIGDEAQLDRLFRRSALYRDKWDEVHGDATYGQRTMHTVLNQDRDRWTPRQASRNSQSADTDHEASDGARQARHQTLPLSDQTNAEALVRTHGKDLRYSHPAKQWYVWDGRRWRADETAAIMRFAKSTIKAMAACIPEMDDDQAKASLAHIKTSLSAPRLKSMVELATSEPGIPVLPHELDQDPWLSNCLNGTLNLKTRELQPHRREDLITKLAPVAYDPKARSARWDDFLTRVLPDESVRGYVQRAAGYSLTGLGTEEVLFFPFGPTKTGKSTLLKALRATMGEYATTADFETFLARDHITGSPRQDIADLAGKRLVVSLEVDQGKRLAEGLIKWLFGGDYVKARFLYQREFEFLPTFKLWLAANHRPQVSPDDDAIWERIRQIAFDQHIPKAERDPGVKAELSDPEQSGAAILAWAVQGCFDWQQQGLDDPVKVTAATEDYRKEMNPLPDFLEACTIPKDRGRILNADLWSRYQAWARKNPDRPRLGRKTFTQQLEARGLDSLESGGHRFWLGIELRYTTGEAEEKE